ncbi:hypothetical protein [Microcystis phage Mwe-JY26]
MGSNADIKRALREAQAAGATRAGIVAFLRALPQSYVEGRRRTLDKDGSPFIQDVGIICHAHDLADCVEYDG